MFNLIIYILLFFFSQIAFSQGYNQNSDLIDKIDRLERDLIILQKQFYRGETPNNNVRPQYNTSTYKPNNSASMEAKIDNIEEEIKTLRGKMEELDFIKKQFDEKLQKLQKDNEFRFQELENSLNNTKGPISKNNLKAHDESLDIEPEQNSNTIKPQVLDKPKNLNQYKTDIDDAVSTKKPKITSKNLFDDEKENTAKTEFEESEPPLKKEFNGALAAFKQQKYDEAERKFTKFIQSHANDPLSGHAYFWIGETHYAKKNYEKAALNYLKGYKKFNDGSKAPESLLKLSIALHNLKKNKESCSTLSKLKKEFPEMSTTIRKKMQETYSKYACK